MLRIKLKNILTSIGKNAIVLYRERNIMNKINKIEKTFVELFAGVGGFRVGIENADSEWETVFTNQWEPSKKNQFAFNCYKEHFSHKKGINEFSNCDITEVSTDNIPNHTLLVGGFPCQDYSVATTAAKGINGKKGVLWWEIERIVRDKRPPFVLLENVDRLLKSPSNQKGRDFGIILACLSKLGYGVEWRVINAADYGFVQKRRRVFIFAFHNKTKYYNKISNNEIGRIISTSGIFAKQFMVKNIGVTRMTNISYDLQDISNNFRFRFENSGIILNNDIYTCDINPEKSNSEQLRNILEDNPKEKYYLLENEVNYYKKLKHAHSIERVSKLGYKYTYRAGNMDFPDSIDKPARTILTNESSKSRTTHIIEDPKTHRLRKLTPLECERINGFPDNWTNVANLTDSQRYFCMGNALVIGIVTKIINELNNIIKTEQGEQNENN